MEVLQLIALIGLSMETRALFPMTCYEEMSYHEKYGYGYDINCSYLNDSTIGELQNTMVYNEIRLTISKSNLSHVSSKWFQNIPKTREVIISDSNLDLQTVPPEGPFGNLQQLELLSMSGNKLLNISKDSLRNLSSLRVLNVSHNDLSAIEADTLSNVQDLEVLDLSGNRFESLETIPLCELARLKRLFLAFNQLTLSNSSMECLQHLKLLVLDFNSISDVVSLAQLHHVVKVSLGYNKLVDLRDAFSGLRHLEDLNLESNSLRVVDSGFFSNTSSLKRLNLRNNSINSIHPKAIVPLVTLEDLNLEQNNLSQAPVANLPSLKRLSLSHNPLSWEKQDFTNLTKLEYLSLNNCGIRSLTSENFKFFATLKTLDLSFNKVELGKSSFNGLTGLHQLNLKGNSLLVLPDYAFKDLVNLKSLDLSKNQLKQLNHLTFYNLKRLETLNLSYNFLETLAENVMVPLGSLSKLDLEGNRLKSIDYNIIFSLLLNLKFINVRANKLSCELLTQMLNYFKERKINYTITEKLSYTEENVAGIPCQENDKFNSSFQIADALLFNDTKLLNEIYYTMGKGSDDSLSKTLLILGLVLLVLFVCIVGISYRIYVIVKRRNCVSDEIELLDTRLHKWNYVL